MLFDWTVWTTAYSRVHSPTEKSSSVPYVIHFEAVSLRHAYVRSLWQTLAIHSNEWIIRTRRAQVRQASKLNVTCVSWGRQPELQVLTVIYHLALCYDVRLSAHSDMCIVDHFAECNCFGHADACVYNESVAERLLSINIYGVYEGGGVCIDCRVSFRLFSCK